MGEYTFTEFSDYLKFRLRQRSELSTVSMTDTTNLYGVWVNAAYRELCTKKKFFEKKFYLKFPELDTTASISTVDGQATIAVESGTLYTYGIWDNTNNESLDNIGWRTYMRKTDRTTESARGKPKNWVRFGANYYLYPTPDDIYDMRPYYRVLPDEISGTQTTAVSDIYDEAILELAAHKGHRWLGEYDQAKEVKEAFLDILQDLAGIYDTDELAGKKRLKPSGTMMNHYKGSN